jgi:DNA repair protein RecN (Recombination protein N)
MIDRVYIKDCLSFEEIDLTFDKGLNIFTGPSGAGKSILMQSILSLFSICDVKASLGEVSLINSNISNELFDIEKNDDIFIKSIKKEKVRFFINNQSLSKKNLNEFSSSLIKHLNLRDTSDFDSKKLIVFLDKLSCNKYKEFDTLKVQFDLEYKELVKLEKELSKILEDENKLEDLKEFARFEIEKIESINPGIDEYDELNEIKKKLTKKEKIEEAIKDASIIFDNTHLVSNALEVLEEDSSFFDETINELSNLFERFNDSLEDLEELDIENVLDRIEKLSALQKRFGSIESALKYKDEKKAELESYENISFEKTILEKKINTLSISVQDLSKKLSEYRSKSAKTLQEILNKYLKALYLNDAKINLLDKKLDYTGIDLVEFTLSGVSLKTISSGEFNRLRLALLTSISKFDIVENGILFLDEIDANLSGKESEAIAKVLTLLSKSYQIFAISHQPQLTSSANQHYLVDKNENISNVKLLNKEEKIKEIARMISGENITKEALEFSKNFI